MGVTSVHTPPVEFLRNQLETLAADLLPGAIKVGMLGDDVDITLEVGRFLKGMKENGKGEEEGVFVVLDPVMISTSGQSLIGDKVKQVMIEYLFPYVDLITPNKFEAEEFLGRKLVTVDDIEQGELSNLTVTMCLWSYGIAIYRGFILVGLGFEWYTTNVMIPSIFKSPLCIEDHLQDKISNPY